MAAILLFLVASILQIVLGVDVYPQNKPNYTDSFIPPSAQVLYHVIELTDYDVNSPKSYVEFDGKRPTEISTMTGIEEGRDKKEVTPTQKQLLHLHNLLTREAKLQGLGKYQGYSDDVLEVLRETSKMTAAEQLKVVLEEALSRNNMKRSDTKEAAEKVVKDLANSESDLHKTMEDFEALQYT